MPNSEEWVHDHSALPAVQPYALDSKLCRECGWVRPLLCPLVYGFIGNKPRVAPATFVLAVRVGPTINVGFVSVGHADSQSIQLCFALRSEMKNVLVAIVQEPARVDRFEMPVRVRFRSPLNRDGLDPVDGIMQVKQLPYALGNVKGKIRVFRGISQIQEKRAVRLQDPGDFTTPLSTPFQVIFVRLLIVVSAILYSKVIGGRRYHHIDRFRVQLL